MLNVRSVRRRTVSSAGLHLRVRAIQLDGGDQNRQLRGDQGGIERAETVHRTEAQSQTERGPADVAVATESYVG